MQQFIPFEDDWDALANLRLEDLVPYRVGMLRSDRCDAPGVPPSAKAALTCGSLPAESQSVSQSVCSARGLGGIRFAR